MPRRYGSAPGASTTCSTSARRPPPRPPSSTDRSRAEDVRAETLPSCRRHERGEARADDVRAETLPSCRRHERGEARADDVRAETLPSCRRHERGEARAERILCLNGQACEFDYSGTQACKALREEGFEVVLVNSNPATIMTDPEMADRTYVEPL